MRWHRNAPGHYTSGPYRVKRHGDDRWWATGPGVDSHDWPTKTAAQAKCVWAAEARPLDADPVIGDRVKLADGREGNISALLQHDTGEVYTYVVRLPRKRRTCVLRGELELVTEHQSSGYIPEQVAEQAS